jgi:hypothetical protein
MKMNNKLYLVTTNDKKYEEWCKQQKKKLKGAALDSFNQGYNEMLKSPYLTRASFVCYWEIYSTGTLAKLAPAITQASLIHMLHRFVELDAHQEIEVLTGMISNFTRLLARLGESHDEEE